MVAVFVCVSFFFQAEDGIRDLVRSRGLGDVYKRQVLLVGPRRVVPICQLAMQEPALVHAMLDQQLTGQMPGDLDGMLLIAEHYEQPVSYTHLTLPTSDLV